MKMGAAERPLFRASFAFFFSFQSPCRRNLNLFFLAEVLAVWQWWNCYERQALEEKILLTFNMQETAVQKYSSPKFELVSLSPNLRRARQHGEHVHPADGGQQLATFSHVAFLCDNAENPSSFDAGARHQKRARLASTCQATPVATMASQRPALAPKIFTGKWCCSHRDLQIAVAGSQTFFHKVPASADLGCSQNAPTARRFEMWWQFWDLPDHRACQNHLVIATNRYALFCAVLGFLPLDILGILGVC